jgi:hypothetical protein
VIRWENDLTPYEARSVAAIFENQSNQLNQQSPDVGNLLKLLSFLDPENIPVTMIVDGARESLKNRAGGRELFSPKHIARKFKAWSQKILHTKRHTKGKPPADATESSHISPFDSLITLILSPIEFQRVIQKLQSLSLPLPSRFGGGYVFLLPELSKQRNAVFRPNGSRDEIFVFFD